MKRTILLADDSPTIRRLVTQTFADGNFKIVEVSNGDAAIKTFEEVRPSVVLTDIYMPGKNGYEVCAYVRNHPSLGQTPVVLLVGAFDAFDEETAKRSGATASITKPFEPGALIEMVKSILRPESKEAEGSPEPRKQRPEPMDQRGQPRTAASAASSAVPAPFDTPEPAPEPDENDLLGLEMIFKESAAGAARSGAMTDEEIGRIADRVLRRISSQVIERIAWDIVPDITEKIVREELRRIDES